MRDKAKSAISMMLTVILAFSVFAVTIVALTGCSTYTEDSAEVVTYSNGGSVVEYGEHIYFINGMGSYPDTNSKVDYNEYGKIQRGALYRAKKQAAVYKANPSEEEVATYRQSMVDFEGKELGWEELRNYKITDKYDEDENSPTGYTQHKEKTSSESEFQISVELIVPKIIGSPYFRAGIYIFDGRIYFASPSNTLDKDGNYQYNKIDFFSCNTDGTNLTKLYTTTAAADDSTATEEDDEGNVTETGEGDGIKTIPYNFTKQNGKVYLSTFEKWYASGDDELEGNLTGYVVTVEIVNGVSQKTTIVAENVSGAVFPVKETYYSQKKGGDQPFRYEESTNTINDFVYIIRPANKDAHDYGSVIEMMRPDGTDRAVVINNGKVASIEGISGHYLYYRNKYEGRDTLEYTNLYAQLVESSYEKEIKDGIQTIKKENDVPVKKQGGKTFLDEQELIVKDFKAWEDEGSKSDKDRRYINYMNGYVVEMISSGPILIDDINDNLVKIDNIFLYPQNSVENGSDVRVIGFASSNMYNIGSKSKTIISGQKLNILQYHEGRLYGYNDENNFSHMSAILPAGSNNIAELSTKYSYVNSNSVVPMELFDVHDENGNVADTYAAYFTNFPSEKAIGYMAVIKVGGTNAADGYYAVAMADVLPSEMKAIECADPICLDYTHDHSTRDGYKPGEVPEDNEGGETDSTFM